MKKKLFLYLLVCLPVVAFAQGGKYIVEGSVGTYSTPAKVYLRYWINKRPFLDSTSINNGKFRFEGNVLDDPIVAQIALAPKGARQFDHDNKQIFLDTGVTTIIGSGRLQDAVVAGTKVNLEKAKLDAALTSLKSINIAIDSTRNKSTHEQQQPVEFKKKMDSLLSLIRKQKYPILKKFIQDNPDSYISLVELDNYAYSFDYSDIAPLFDGLSDRIKQTVRAQYFAKLLPRLKAVALGSIAPEITERDTSGKLINLSSLRGKYVLVDFWASWSTPCRQESPSLVKVFGHYKDMKFTIFGVSLEAPTGKSRWLAAIHEDSLKWTQVSDFESWDCDAAGVYGVKTIPQYFLLDPDGKIIAKNVAFYDLQSELEDVLGKL